MKRITCFINSLAGGGAEHQLINLANLLSEHSYNVTFLTYNDSDDGQYSLKQSVKHLMIKTKGGKLRKSLQVFFYLIKYDTDCFVSFRSPVNTILLFPMLFRRRVKCIVGERNLTVGKLTVYEFLNFNFLYRRADYIVPNSVSQTEFILKKFPCYKHKLITIQNYTELDKYYPVSSPEGETLVFGVFCRYAEQKNYICFARAVKLLKDKGKKNCVFKWYGKAFYNDGTINIHYERFQSIIHQLGIDDMVELHDIVIDVPKAMAQVDVFCLPSLYEGFSNSLSEAICCAKPIVASNVSDNHIMVKEGVNGFLFNPKDISEMASAFERMISVPTSERKRMSSASRMIAESVFDREKFVDSYISLIEN